MLANKGRSLLTLVGIIVATIMFTIVASAHVSALDVLRGFVSDEYGTWHVQGYSMPTFEFSQISEDERLNDVAYVQELGYVDNYQDMQMEQGFSDTLFFESGVYNGKYLPRYAFFFAAMSPNFPEMGNLRVVRGRLPENNTEVLIPLELYSSSGLEIGTEFTASIHSRYSEGRKVNNLNRLVTKNGDVDEQLYQIGNKEYTVVGYYVLPEYVKWDDFSRFTILTIDFELITGNTVNAYFELSDPADYIAFSEEYFESDSDCLYNKDFIRMENSADDRPTMQKLAALSAIAISMIILLAVMLIYNSFSTSSSERVRAIGLLKSVGATKKQVRQLMCVEAFYFSIIGIPTGIILGQGASWILFRMVSGLTRTAARYFVEKQIVVSYRLSIQSIVGPAVMALATILVAILLPMAKVSSIAPIEAIRASGSFHSHGANRRIYKLWNRLFSFTGALSLKNYSRYRRRYRATVISIVASVIMIMFAHTMVGYLSQGETFGVEETKYEHYLTYTLSLNDRDFTADDRALFYNLADQKGVRSSTLILSTSMNSYINMKLTTQKFQEMFDDFKDSTVIRPEFVAMDANVIFLEDSAFRDLCSSNGIDPEPYLIYGADNCLIDNRMYVYEGDSLEESCIEVYSDIPDELEILLPTPTSNGISIVTLKPTGSVEMDLDMGDGDMKLIMPMSRYSYYDLRRITGHAFFLFESEDPASLYSRFKPILEENLYRTDALEDKGVQVRAQKATVTLANIVLYGYVAMLSFLCFLNVILTVIGNIVFRRKEYILLTSVGMSRKTMFRMVISESQVYFAESTFILLLILFAFFLPQICLSGWASIPLNEVVFALVVLFLHWFAVVSTTAIGLSRVMRDEIVEGLRKEYY